MISTTPRRPLFLIGAAILAACSSRPADSAGKEVAGASWLYVFTGDADGTMAGMSHASPTGGDPDFLTVIDADPASPSYAKVVATLPTGAAGMPHHTEMEVPAGGRPLFANAYSGKTWLFDLADPRKPRIAGTLDSVPGFRSPHSFFRLPDGNVVATIQFGDGTKQGDPGALALFAPDGKLLRVSPAADSTFPGAEIRIYSLDVSPATDRILATSSPMDTTSTTADVIQLWRLSDLTLLKTLELPRTVTDSTSRYPFEVRFLPGGRSAVLNTYNCGIYHLAGLDGAAPTLEPVLALPQPANVACSVPLLIGRWWLLPIQSRLAILVYDLSDPRKPREAGLLAADSSFAPHWLSREPGTDRIVVSAEGPVPAVRVARFDSATGTLKWDEKFRDRPDGPPGVSFDRVEWPHGRTGKALPHGAVFSRPPA